MSDIDNPINITSGLAASAQETTNPKPTVPVSTDEKLDMNVLTHTLAHTDISPFPVQQPANQQLTSRAGQNLPAKPPPSKPISLFECSLENVGLLSEPEAKKLLYDAYENGTLEAAFIKLKGTDGGAKILYELCKFLPPECECDAQSVCLKLMVRHELVPQIFGDDTKNLANVVDKAISSVPNVEAISSVPHLGWFFRFRIIWAHVANVFATYCLTSE